MKIPEKAAQWAVDIAKDDSHGYDQGNRWGTDYDCSSLVISAYKHAGVPLSCTYTGNMRSDMLMNGFVPAPVDLKTGEGLRVGDVLLNEKSHTAIYIGNALCGLSAVPVANVASYGVRAWLLLSACHLAIATHHN
jgi:cell wall-associated NlpC family hydrolase